MNTTQENLCLEAKKNTCVAGRLFSTPVSTPLSEDTDQIGPASFQTFQNTLVIQYKKPLHPNCLDHHPDLNLRLKNNNSILITGQEPPQSQFLFPRSTQTPPPLLEMHSYTLIATLAFAFSTYAAPQAAPAASAPTPIPTSQLGPGNPPQCMSVAQTIPDCGVCLLPPIPISFTPPLPPKTPKSNQSPTPKKPSQLTLSPL